MKSKSKMKRIIHIHAKCKAFEFFEQIDEKKAVQRLTDIKDGFIQLKMDDSKKGKLVVNTVLVNPEFNFR